MGCGRCHVSSCRICWTCLTWLCPPLWRLLRKWRSRHPCRRKQRRNPLTWILFSWPFLSLFFQDKLCLVGNGEVKMLEQLAKAAWTQVAKACTLPLVLVASFSAFFTADVWFFVAEAAKVGVEDAKVVLFGVFECLPLAVVWRGRKARHPPLAFFVALI